MQFRRCRHPCDDFFCACGLLDVGEQVVTGVVHRVEEGRRLQANPEDQNQNRDECRQFIPAQVQRPATFAVCIMRVIVVGCVVALGLFVAMIVVVLWCDEFAHKHTLEHVQDVDRRHDDAQRCKQREEEAQVIATKRPQQNRKLTDEAVQTRQAHAAERNHQADRTEEGRNLPDAAVFGHVLCVIALVQDADNQEEAAGADAVIDHLQRRALQALRVQREDAQHHKAQVRDGRIRDQLLHVRLCIADPCAIDDADNG